jgi:2-succinyl-5-enolpyruvyl-6-hydroxy-3-cyclohexene-1-carboxylate synthase
VAVQPLALLSEALMSAPSKDGLIAAHRASAVASKLDMLVESHPLSEVAWMRHLSEVMPSGALLFLGNSLPIREWNLAGRTSGACYANRGANGIDGLVSTFYGLSEEAAESWMILGDLSALYDLAAPWIAEQLSPGNRRIVIINNGGGKIFSRVESLQKLDDTARTMIENRHAIDFRPWAELWRMDYRLVQTPEDLAGLPAGDVIMEVRPDAMQTEAFWQAW